MKKQKKNGGMPENKYHTLLIYETQIYDIRNALGNNPTLKSQFDDAIFNYGFRCQIPEENEYDPMVILAFNASKRLIEKDHDRINANRANGANGGRPSIDNDINKKNPAVSAGCDGEQPKAMDPLKHEHEHEQKSPYSPPEGGECASKKTNKAEEYSEGFEEFWIKYPKHVGKKTAFRSWSKLNMTPELYSRILSAVQHASQSPQWQKDGGQYVPNPSTYINQERWNDEISTTTVSTNTATQKLPKIAELKKSKGENQ